MLVASRLNISTLDLRWTMRCVMDVYLRRKSFSDAVDESSVSGDQNRDKDVLPRKVKKEIHHLVMASAVGNGARLAALPSRRCKPRLLPGNWRCKYLSGRTEKEFPINCYRKTQKKVNIPASSSSSGVPSQLNLVPIESQLASTELIKWAKFLFRQKSL